MGSPTIEPRRPWFFYAVAGVGVCLIATAPLRMESDGKVRLDVLDHLLRTGQFKVSAYSLIGPTIAAPLWWVGQQIDEIDRTVCLFNRLIFLGMLLGLWRLLSRVLEAKELEHFLIFLLFGSMFPWHIEHFFGEVFQTGCVGFGLAAVVRGGRWAWVGWPLAAIGTSNLPGTAVGLASAAALLAWERRRLRYVLVLAAVAAAILFENYLRRGTVEDGGYGLNHGHQTVLPYSGLPRFSYPLFFGLLSTLFSFGRGLIFFAPGLFLRYPRNIEFDAREREVRQIYRVWMAVVVGLVLVYSRWWAWYGGYVWGPRFYLLACLPASLVLARWTAWPERRTLRANLLVLAATALSFWTGASGLVWGTAGAKEMVGDNEALEAFTFYVPECSDHWRPFVLEMPLGWADELRLASFAVAFLYIAAPVGRVAAGQLWRRWLDFRRERRQQPAWRI